MKQKKKKKKKLKITGLIFLILCLYLIGMLIYYIFTVPVKNINIKNNHLVTEAEIIKTINISDKTPIIKLSEISIRKKLLKLDLIEKVEVKKSLLGDLIINVTENKILFYNVLNKEFVLSNEKSIEDDGIYFGYPTLINYVPSETYSKFIKSFSNIDKDIISMVSEIEYSPDVYENTTLDAERFLLRMNDQNKIYINISNIEKLNNYQTILSSVNQKGTLYLDSSSDNYIFNTKEEVPEEEKEDKDKEEKKDEE